LLLRFGSIKRQLDNKTAGHQSSLILMSFSQFTNKIASDYQPPGASLLTFI